MKKARLALLTLWLPLAGCGCPDIEDLAEAAKQQCLLSGGTYSGYYIWPGPDGCERVTAMCAPGEELNEIMDNEGTI